MSDLFEAAAERIAYEGGFSLRCDDCGTVDDECFCIGATATRIPNKGGRNVAQVRIELKHGTLDSTVQTCATCGSAFMAKPRTPAVCNLCRRVPA
jgi:DNA-directed RNA polymerase subunit RPC12/RpoP